MKVFNNISLKKYNTFGIDVTARELVIIDTEQELKTTLTQNNDNLFILGGGSNMLLTKNLETKVLQINLKGIEITKEDDDFVWLKVQAGEVWHELVLWCLDHNYGGIENLSLIPGNVGTSPIQNIGAYGVELKDVFYQCEAIHSNSGVKRIFSKSECNFGYRESIFKNTEKGNYVICNVTLKLTKTNHTLHTGYGAIQTELEQKGINTPSIKDVSNAIIAIRKSKLPDPAEIGNSGSFFKNPVVNKKVFEEFFDKFPEAPFYKVTENSFKIPAGWLIEQAGFKGKRFGDAGIHKNQALVLVNYGNASGSEIWNLALKIKETVYQQFGITIDPEVNIV